MGRIMSECQNKDCADHVQELLETNEHLRKLLYHYIGIIESDYPDCEQIEVNQPYVPIACLRLSSRTQRCLHRAGIKTLSELEVFMCDGTYRTHRRSRHAVRNFGERSFFHTKNAIREYKESQRETM